MESYYLKELIDRYEAASFTVNRRLNALIRETMNDELTIDQFSTLRYIHRHERCTSTELADIFCVGKSAITAIITRLVGKNFIIRTGDKNDRRVLYLSLSEEGTKIYLETEQKIQLQIGEYITHFNHQEIESFISSFERLAHIMILDEKGSEDSE